MSRVCSFNNLICKIVNANYYQFGVRHDINLNLMNRFFLPLINSHVVSGFFFKILFQQSMKHEKPKYFSVSTMLICKIIDIKLN